MSPITRARLLWKPSSTKSDHQETISLVTLSTKNIMVMTMMTTTEQGPFVSSLQQLYSGPFRKPLAFKAA